MEHIHCDALSTFAHEGYAEIRPVGDQRREQRGIEALGQGRYADQWPEGPGKLAPGIDLAEQIFDPHPGQMRVHHPPQGAHLCRDLQGIPVFEMQPTINNRRKRVPCQALGHRCGHVCKVGVELGECAVGIAW
jgi:hypothetical protein